MQQGPDGLVYAVTDSPNGRVLRIGPVTPCVPQSWPSYEVRYRAGEKMLELLFLRDGNMQKRWTGPVIAQHDGVFALNLDSIGDSQPVLLLLLCVSRVALQTSERFTSVRMTTKSA